MILLIAVALSFFVPWPWSLVIVLGGIILEVGEVIWGLRLARRWRPKTGAEAMIGMRAEVVSALHPNGQVRLKGELWEASCVAGAEPGDEVIVRRMEGLTLIVEPVLAEGPSRRDDARLGTAGLSGDGNERREPS
jgi:membrane protein implicated in regulation of membrane protease activity